MDAEAGCMGASPIASGVDPFEFARASVSPGGAHTAHNSTVVPAGVYSVGADV